MTKTLSFSSGTQFCRVANAVKRQLSPGKRERDALLSLYDAQNPRQTDVVRLRGDGFSRSKSPKNKDKNES